MFARILPGEGLKQINKKEHNFNEEKTAKYFRQLPAAGSIQETWLCDATAYRLTDSMDSFVVAYQSAMEQKLLSGIHKGRPFGGTAVLADKSLSKFTHHLITDNPRRVTT